MLKMVETFSGIGAQAKALLNINEKYNYKYEILNTADWDINAIIAYDLIHYKNQDLSHYEKLTKEEILEKILPLSLSTDGKTLATKEALKRLNINVLIRLCCAIDRSKNLISVTDIKGSELPEDMNILTYSFPCQDLSIARAWHGSSGGINRNSNNRSSMLWQIERILKERKKSKKEMPRFLLMENVRNIQSKEHKANFEEWQKSLEDLGYFNHVYKLNAKNFGIPQNRVRVYMLSFYIDGDISLKKRIEEFINNNNLENFKEADKSVADLLRTDYSNSIYKLEADANQINNTKSRRDICAKNAILYDYKSYIDLVPTITTKQDRHPNSGVIKYNNKKLGKCDFRYLTPRECFMLMGFDESDFQILLDNNFNSKNKNKFFSDSKLIKMAGNSIVVNVLEEIFKQINDINDNIYQK